LAHRDDAHDRNGACDGSLPAAAIVGYAGYDDGEVGTGPLVLVLCAFIVPKAGGWLGGAIVFVHGMRVLGLPDEPASSAVSPGCEKKERAAAD
jgi:hypothetical protein